MDENFKEFQCLMEFDGIAFFYFVKVYSSYLVFWQL